MSFREKIETDIKFAKKMIHFSFWIGFLIGSLII